MAEPTEEGVEGVERTVDDTDDSSSSSNVHTPPRSKRASALAQAVAVASPSSMETADRARAL